MRLPEREEITKKLSRPVCEPICFLSTMQPNVADGAEIEALWRTPGMNECDTMEIRQNPLRASVRALKQARFWALNSVNAVLTLSLRCVVPPTAAYMAYRRAHSAHLTSGACCRLTCEALGFGILTSVAGMAVNALQAVCSGVFAGVCVGLSLYLYTHAALETFLPPRVIVTG